MSTPAFSLVEAEAVLARTPRVLTVLLDGLPDAWLDERNEGDESFSPRDVLGHLIGGDRTDWIARVRIIMEHGEKRPFDPFDRFSFRKEVGAPIATLLRTFAQLRERNLAELQALRLHPSDLERKGVHPAFGPVTLRQLLATWVVHDLSHLAQIERVLGRRYLTDVGPWREYLPMLDRR